MEDSQKTLLELLMLSWGVITAALAVLVIYRGTLTTREDDQIFIGDAEQLHVREQEAILARIHRLSAPIIALTAISGVLLLASAGLWIYRGLKGF